MAAARRIVELHGGQVPRTRAELEALPGVGQKSAGVILLQQGVEAAFPVDTHVGRLARRLGFTRQQAPGRVEAELRQLFPQELVGPRPPAAGLARPALLHGAGPGLRPLSGGGALPQPRRVLDPVALEPSGRTRRNSCPPRKVRAPEGKVPANGRSGRPAGKCHREQTAERRREARVARVKGCGKSAPRSR